ncbi:MAG TPA: membrane dipeptidase [Anaerolineales bacterium]|jgi:membrane dipeptidase|nr:membrane dipeptidase [Anaerolineales bacterium]
MPLIIDSHQDLAWNMLTYGRDYTRSAYETRRLEASTITPELNGDCTVGWPEYQRGQIAVVFATLFAPPARKKETGDTILYADSQMAHRLYRDQIDFYRRLADSHPDKFSLISSHGKLDSVIEHWSKPVPQGEGHPVGLIYLMEGADGIRSPDELAEWYDLGLRMIGLAWAGTRYAGGTGEPGPLTEEGRKLLSAMTDYNFLLDLSHMDEAAALESLDRYEGPIMATHSNCAALMKGAETNRHLPDAVIRGLIERDGVIGLIPLNTFLKVGWLRKRGSRREEVSLDTYIAHIDHICQLAGNANHAGIGSDFDGGFGVQSIPHELDTIADLQMIASRLIERGYSEADAENILGGNWLRFLRQHLPA